MPLSSEQKRALIAEANRRGIDAGKLIAAAEANASGQAPSQTAPGADATQTGEPGDLFMYLLPFVTVGEVRKLWLKVDGAFPDMNANAAEYAARFAASSKPASDPPEQ